MGAEANTKPKREATDSHVQRLVCAGDCAPRVWVGGGPGRVPPIVRRVVWKTSPPI